YHPPGHIITILPVLMTLDGKYTSKLGSMTFKMTRAWAFFCYSCRSDFFAFGISPSQRGMVWFWAIHKWNDHKNSIDTIYFIVLVLVDHQLFAHLNCIVPYSSGHPSSIAANDFFQLVLYFLLFHIVGVQSFVWPIGNGKHDIGATDIVILTVTRCALHVENPADITVVFCINERPDIIAIVPGVSPIGRHQFVVFPVPPELEEVFL